MTPEGEAGTSDGTALPDSVIADLRADDRRRLVLSRLAEGDRPLPVSDLARYVAAAEEDRPVEEAPDDAADAIRRDIFQNHLPKLTATGVVRYDSLVGTVELAVDDERVVGDEGDEQGPQAAPNADG